MDIVFEVTIKPKTEENKWPVIVKREEQGEILAVSQEGSFQLNLVSLRSHIMPADYGTELGMALFHDRIRDAFVSALAKSEEKLHIALFVEDKELRTLHWEWLCAPFSTGWKLLTLEQKTPFSFYLPSMDDRVFAPIEREDLRTLILAANPENLSDFDLSYFDEGAHIEGVQKALGDIPYSTLSMTPGAIALPTLDNLNEQLTANDYTMLHIVAHGRFSKRTGETLLYLSDSGGKVDPIRASRFLERLSSIGNLPYFVFLSTCESAAQDAEGVLGGLAQRLVRDLGIPAVIAMTDSVSIKTAQILSEKFYLRLKEHGMVDLALVEACASLAERHDVTVPVLYSRLRARPLFGTSVRLTERESRMSSRLANLEDMVDKTRLDVEQQRIEIEKSRIEQERSARQIAQIKYDDFLEDVDRSWTEEKKDYLVAFGGEGKEILVEPTNIPVMIVSVIMAIAAVAIGGLLLYLGGPIFSIGGIIAIIGGILSPIIFFIKRSEYEEAYARYYERRRSRNVEYYYNQIMQQSDKSAKKAPAPAPSPVAKDYKTCFKCLNFNPKDATHCSRCGYSFS